ncbi:MAG TPA: amidohydrolase family protein [Bryobacteraceae bacterium]|nr:amidohydrolase family protein [Bryobacteraceae bacterium]
MTDPSRVSPVIDFHAHVLDPDVFRRTIQYSVATGFGARPMPLPDKNSPAWKMFGGMLDAGVQLRDMDSKGIDIGVLSTATVVQSTWWAPPALAAELDRRANEGIAEWVERYPARFTGSFTIPLQDVDTALKEMDYAVSRLKMKLANVSSNIGGVYLGDPKMRPFWEAARSLGVTVLIHPHGVTDPKFQKFALWNGVGQPIEETLAMASLIYEGIFDSFPEVKVVIVHGGGYLPHYYGRLDRNATAHPISMQNIKRLPSEYARSVYYDSCVYAPSVLEALIERVGADRIVFGTDYPFGEQDPVANIRKTKGLSDADFQGIVSGTAAGILGLASA